MTTTRTILNGRTYEIVNDADGETRVFRVKQDGRRGGILVSDKFRKEVLAAPVPTFTSLSAAFEPYD